MKKIGLVAVALVVVILMATESRGQWNNPGYSQGSNYSYYGYGNGYGYYGAGYYPSYGYTGYPYPSHPNINVVVKSHEEWDQKGGKRDFEQTPPSVESQIIDGLKTVISIGLIFR
jgi:hypothetical protein